MFSELELEIVCASCLFIAFANGQPTNKDISDIRSFIKKLIPKVHQEYQSPKVYIERLRQNLKEEPLSVDKIMNAAYDRCLSTNKYAIYGFFSSLKMLDEPIKSQVTTFWIKLAGESKKKIDVSVSLLTQTM